MRTHDHDVDGGQNLRPKVNRIERRRSDVSDGVWPDRCVRPGADMAVRLGHNFGDVRVHTDSLKAADERALVEEQSRRNKSTAVRPSGQDVMHTARSPVPSISVLQRLQAGAGNAAVSRLLAQRPQSPPATAATSVAGVRADQDPVAPITRSRAGAVRDDGSLTHAAALYRTDSADAGVVVQRGCQCGGQCDECGPQAHGQGTNAVREDPPVQRFHEITADGGPPQAAVAQRVHRGHDAAESVCEFGAYAYPVENPVVCGAGRCAPEGMLAGKAPAEALIPAAFPMVFRQPAGGAKNTKQATGEEDRAALLKDFTGGAGLDEQVSDIASAMRAFSLRQLQAMRTAEVRFWGPDGLPPFKESVTRGRLSKPAEYLPPIRVIRIAKNASTDAIRHEMAHAWDHVRTGKVKPIRKLTDKAWKKALEDTPPFSSATTEKRATKEIVSKGKMRSVRMPISEMFARYTKWGLREQSFDNPSTQTAHSKESPADFYAEGYSVFHGGKEDCQARLLYYAPELYELLEAEAKQQRLGVPDRAKMEAELKAQNLQW